MDERWRGMEGGGGILSCHAQAALPSPRTKDRLPSPSLIMTGPVIFSTLSRPDAVFEASGLDAC